MEGRLGRGGDPTPQPEALQRLDDVVASIHDSETFRRWLDVAARFHTYSLNNQLLIAAQRPDATHVAGFHAWKKLGRQVRKGEKGIAIVVPRERKVVTEEGDEEHRVTGFGTGFVFDISQTDGDPLPEFSVPVLEGEAGSALWYRLLDVASRDSLTVTVVEPAGLPPETMGFYNPAARKISVSKQGRLQRTKTLAHELGHHFARVDDHAENECIAILIHRCGVSPSCLSER